MMESRFGRNLRAPDRLYAEEIANINRESSNIGGLGSVSNDFPALLKLYNNVSSLPLDTP